MSVRIKTTTRRGNKAVYFKPIFKTLKDADRYTRHFESKEEMLEKCIENGDIEKGEYYINDIMLECEYTVKGEEKSRDLRPIFHENRELELYKDILQFLGDVKDSSKVYGKDKNGIRNYLQGVYGLDRPEFFDNNYIKNYIKNLYFWSERKYDEVLTAFNNFLVECFDTTGKIKDSMFFDPEEYSDFDSTSLNFYYEMFQTLLDIAGNYTATRDFYMCCSNIPEIKKAYDVYSYDNVNRQEIDPYEGLERPYELDDPRFFDDDEDIEPGGKQM